MAEEKAGGDSLQRHPLFSETSPSPQTLVQPSIPSQTAKMTSLHVGNLPYSMSEEDLGNFFSSSAGCQVVNVRMPTDRETGWPKGFAFVELADPSSLEKALELNGADCNGRPLRINVAQGRDNSGGGSGGAGGGSGCRKCGEEGHFARECPQGGGGGGGGGSGCRKCGEEGHFARECPQGGDGGGGGGGACHKCGEEGHFSRECPKAGPCRRCGEEGHSPRDCHLPPPPCRRCKQEGHETTECEQPPEDREKNFRRCGQEEHFARDSGEEGHESLNLTAPPSAKRHRRMGSGAEELEADPRDADLRWTTPDGDRITEFGDYTPSELGLVPFQPQIGGAGNNPVKPAELQTIGPNTLHGFDAHGAKRSITLRGPQGRLIEVTASSPKSFYSRYKESDGTITALPWFRFLRLLTFTDRGNWNGGRIEIDMVENGENLRFHPRNPEKGPAVVVPLGGSASIELVWHQNYMNGQALPHTRQAKKITLNAHWRIHGGGGGQGGLPGGMGDHTNSVRIGIKDVLLLP